MRVWVPLRKEKTIGMVVRIHEIEPDFKTRPVLRQLDDEPVMSINMLQLTEWIHRFYYCSWGEVIQAALPVGLNFVSEKWVRLSHKIFRSDKNSSGTYDDSGLSTGLEDRERMILKEIKNNPVTLREAEKRWRDTPEAALLKKLIQRNYLEIWQEPRQKVSYRKVKVWEWADGVDPETVSGVVDQEKKLKWIQALQVLQDHKLPKSHQELLEDDKITDYTLRRIQQEGLITSEEQEQKGESAEEYPYQPEAISRLSKDQEEVFRTIRNSLDNRQFDSFLFYGVTGSGKTEVYIHTLKHTLWQDRGGIVLIPEIALTPQTVRRFYQIFGDQIAVIHSRLNDRERYEAWQGLKTGEKRIAIGPRSAVFAPVRDLGLIVVDEEHDSSYKQYDPSPRYNARDVAILRASLEEAVVVLGSATPSMTALRGVHRKKHKMLELSSRLDLEMPEVKVLDMKQYRSAMRGPLTIELYQEVDNALNREEQVILLYNRRGFASYLQCEDCGHIPQSPDCSVSLTYHKNRDILLCHYSGYTRKADKVCMQCRSSRLSKKGTGTQQVETEVQKLFPKARLLRMDRDTTTGKKSHQEIYDKFLNGKADILIGTQLVSKGLDFPNVTVVGVLSAETELAFPSYRSGERMFQLLSQVAGRAGRGTKPGKVLVQTWKPDHRAIRFAKVHDYKNFAKEELKEREEFVYPPFSRMIVFHFKGASEKRTEQVAHSFSGTVLSVLPNGSLLGPSPSVIGWMNGLYQWEAHIRINPDHNATAVESLLEKIFQRYEQKKPKGAGSVRITVDVDAVE